MGRNKIGIVLMVLFFMAIGAVFGVMEWRQTAAVYEEAKLIIGDKEIIGYQESYVDHGQIYLPYGVIKDYIDKDYTVEKKDDHIFITLENKELLLEDQALTEFIRANGISMNIPIRSVEGEAYIPINLLKEIFQVEVSFGESSNTVILDFYADITKIAEIKTSGARIKKDKSFFSFFGTKLEKGEKVRVFAEEKNRYRVRRSDGTLGTVEKKYLGSIEEGFIQPQRINERREDFNLDGSKINLAWEYVGKQSPDLTQEDKIGSLDVLSPTWFKITDAKGTVLNNGDRGYVDEAHRKGYKVWGLVTNSFDPELTSTILNSEPLRKKVIGQLVLYGSLYDLDGINVDFENIYYKDRDQLVSFIEELNFYIKKQNLVLTMDMTVPSSSEQWSKVYDRKRLGEIIDFVAVMTYDEHWGSSPVSGSVASIGWVRRGIEKTMESIPKEKILLGLPFYTRQWKEYTENGKIKVESKALSMVAAKNILDEKNVEPLWNEEMGQYYGEYTDGDMVYKIWLEDPRSIGLKVSLVGEYGLAGTAAWRRGFEDNGVWSVLQEMIKNGRSYEDLKFID